MAMTLSLFLLALTGPTLHSWALTLPTQTTTSTTTTTTTTSTTTTTQSPPSSPPSTQADTDEPFTTKRSAALIFDLAKPTHFPLPVVNAEIRTTVPANAATATRPTVERTTTTTQPTTPPRRTFSEAPLYRLNGSNGQACILLQVDALITVKYKTTLGEEQEADIYVPEHATVTGFCDNENFVTMSLKWDAYVLSWSFAKTPGGERWYVDKIELTYNSSDKHFQHIDQPNKTVRLSSAQKHTSMLFPTPVGKSYSCDDELKVRLTDGKNHASVLLRDMKLQPFKFKNNDFADEFSCTALRGRGQRDETAPVAVGSTLAAAVLLTITGYAGWRYFKVKKVKYDTME